MQRAAGLPVQEVDVDRSWKDEKAELGAYGTTRCVEGWRIPRTTTTLTWRDGSMGPAFVTVSSGALSAQRVAELNAEYEGVLKIEETGRDSHMWTGETCLRFFAFLTQELRRKRISLDLDASARALVICDRCGSHQSHTFRTLRKQWAMENNVEVLSGDVDSRLQVPGGFGACSAPNDAWHQFFHMLRRKYPWCQNSHFGKYLCLPFFGLYPQQSIFKQNIPETVFCFKPLAGTSSAQWDGTRTLSCESRSRNWSLP